jgi:hypothetical protein
VTKDEKISDLIHRAVETFKSQPAPGTLTDPKSIAAYYAVFNNPPRWKPGKRIPEETLAPAVKMTARFKRNFGN